MPDHYSPRIMTQQVPAKLLTAFLAPPSEFRNPTVHQPEHRWHLNHARESASRALRCDRRGYGVNQAAKSA